MSVTGADTRQWLFIINGIFGFAVAVAFVLFFPRSNLNTVPLMGVQALNAFNEREKHIMDTRVLLDDPRKHVRLSGIGLKRLAHILLEWRIWAHFAINVITMIPKGGLQIFVSRFIRWRVSVLSMCP